MALKDGRLAARHVSDDQTERLADSLGVSRSDVLAHLGGAWSRLDLDHDEPALRLPREATTSSLWFTSGEPRQVIVGVVASASPAAAIAFVASPAPVMRDWALRYLPGRVAVRVELGQPESMVRLRAAVTEVALLRRKSFFWCRMCRTCNAPEDRFEQQVCLGCAEQYLGVVA